MHTMEKQSQDLRCRVSALEKTQHELQKEVKGLKSSLEKALNSLMPRIDSLLIDRTRGVNAVSTVSGSVVVSPAATSKAFEMDPYRVFLFLWSFMKNIVKYIRHVLPDTSVSHAAHIGDMDTVLSHLKSGYSANQRNDMGFTLLHLAVSGGHEKMVKALLDAGASVNARGPSYTTPLHLAVEKGFINILEILLDAGADINTQNTNNETPLLVALRRGNSDAVNFLIENGASLDEQDREGNTALLLVVKTGDLDMAKLLIEIGASLDKCDRGNKTALWYAVERRANDIVKLLCDKGASQRMEICPLSLASERGNTEALMLILRSKNPPDTYAIINALSSAKDVGVVLAFEDAKPQVMKVREGTDAMIMAAAEGRVLSLKALLDAGVYINSVKRTVISGREVILTALGVAKRNNQTECIKLLLERGAKE